MTTIKDVARVAGVSVATVSRVCNSSPSVKKETRRHVGEVASRLCYTPHGAARSLITSCTYTLGVFLPDLYGEFFSEVIRGIDQTAQQHGYHLLVSSSHDGRPALESAMRSMRGRVDGLIVMWPEVDADIAVRNLPAGFPVVLLNAPASADDFDVIMIANFDGARAMVCHLLDLGHTRIAIIKGADGNVDAAERLRGYRAALSEAGVRASPELEVAGDFNEESGFRATGELMRCGHAREGESPVLLRNVAYHPGPPALLRRCCSRDSAHHADTRAPYRHHSSPMRWHMKMSFVLHGCWALVLATTVLPSRQIAAQTSTGSIRGTVSDSAGAPLSGAEVIALNTASGVQRNAGTNNRGFYSLSGLAPATYQLTIRQIGSAPAARSVQVQVGQTLTLDFRLASAAVQLQEVVVQAPAVETQTSEVATNVTEEQIEALPSSSRNFLDLAPLAPSVRVTPDRINGTGKTFASGASPAENINVFIDGQSFKNDIAGGGVIGQDASRGNPFPRNAVQEFRIITNNFKAEYQKASSAIITAVTKSGSNEWSGSLFTGYQNKGLVSLDSLQRKDRDDTTRTTPFEEPEYSRVLAGGSVGGPLVRDRLFFFGSYEGNFQNRQGVTRLSGTPADWPAAIAGFNGQATTAPFRSHLGFAKLSYNLSQAHLLELNANVRVEKDRRSFGGSFAPADWAYESAERFSNNVVDGGLKHTFFGRNWTNEARVSYQWYQFNPEPLNPALVGQEYQGIGRFGGRDTRQDLTQNRISLRNDWTYSGFQSAGSHVIKLGATVDFLRYNLHKEINENPVFVFNNSNAFAFPVEARYGSGNPDVDGKNTQLGVYLQDDWNPTSRLTINAGIRWDLETGMYDRSFVTPQAVRDSITAFRSQLFVDVDPARYFTDGTQRKNFYGAVQPRVGFSYDINENRTTTVFAAGGIFYDRLGFNGFIDETYRRQHPTYTFRFSADGSTPGTIAWSPAYMSRAGLDGILASGQAPPQEVFLVPNDLKPPKSYQWNVGVRQALGPLLGSVAYTGVRGKNGYSYEFAHVTLNPESNDCCISVNIPAYAGVLVGNNSVRSWYDALELKLDRTYRAGERGGWGSGIAYTLSWADAEGGDLFTFPQIGTAFTGRRSIADDQRHRIVGNWVVDLPFLAGIQFSGLGTFATGKPFNQIEFVQVPASGGGTVNQRALLGSVRGDKFSNLDLRLRKDFPSFGGTRLAVTGDVFNVFNSDNLGCFEETFVAVGPGGVPDPNENFGNATCTVGDPRRFQLGFQYDF